MTDFQFDALMEILKSIDSRLESIESSIPTSAYDMGDLHSAIGGVESAIKSLDR